MDLPLERQYPALDIHWLVMYAGIYLQSLTRVQEFIVVYLNESNVIHSITYLESNGKWLSDVISDEGYTALPNSSIAVMYDQCSRCSNNTIIAFQDENGAVQIGNQTLEGWTKSQLGTALNPVVGTGLALQPFYRSGQQDQINLYHQKSSLNLSLASWHPASEAENIGQLIIPFPAS